MVIIIIYNKYLVEKGVRDLGLKLNTAKTTVASKGHQ